MKNSTQENVPVNVAVKDDLDFEESKRLALQHHLQQVKDPAALVLLRQLKARIARLRRRGTDIRA